MRKIIILAILILFSFTACEGSKTVVKYDGGSLNLSEVGKKAESQLFQLEQQKYQIIQQTAYQMLAEKLLEKEAEEKGMTTDELLAAEAEGSQMQLSDEILRQIYDANRGSFGGSFAEEKEGIKAQIAMGQKQEAEQQYMRSLFKKYNVEFVLEKPEAPKVDVDIEGEPYWGQKDASVTIVEFSDYECPYCRRMQPAIKKIRAEYQDKIKWVFKDFPLDFHQQAIKAHTAAHCAGQQNKYFDYHYRLFDVPLVNEGGRQKMDYSEKRLKKIASSIGLNMSDFGTCLQDKDGSIRAEIQNDIEYAQSIGVRGTPSLFISGVYSSGLRSYEDLKEEIESRL